MWPVMLSLARSIRWASSARGPSVCSQAHPGQSFLVLGKALSVTSEGCAVHFDPIRCSITPDICRKQQRAFHQKLLIKIMATFLKEMPVFICPGGFQGDKQDYKMDKLPVRLEHSGAPSLK